MRYPKPGALPPIRATIPRRTLPIYKHTATGRPSSPKRRRGKRIGHIQARYAETKNYLWYYLHKKKRSRVERFFAQAKGNHGLRQARYWGLVKLKMQVILTALAVNLKRMVTLMENSAHKGGDKINFLQSRISAA